MDYELTDFGGILLKTKNGNIAINGGGTMEQMEKAYIKDGIPPAGFIITCEHYHRSRNAKDFTEKYKIPVLGNLLTRAQLHWVSREPESIQFLCHDTIDFCGVKFSFRYLRYDAIAPEFIIAESNGEKTAFIPDGKLHDREAMNILDCKEIVLCNRLNLLPDASGSLACRMRSISNTDAELNVLFQSFDGKLVRV